MNKKEIQQELAKFSDEDNTLLLFRDSTGTGNKQEVLELACPTLDLAKGAGFIKGLILGRLQEQFPYLMFLPNLVSDLEEEVKKAMANPDSRPQGSTHLCIFLTPPAGWKIGACNWTEKVRV